MQTIDVHDDITIRVDGDSTSGVRLVCSDPNLPAGGSNLIVKAAKLILSECNIDVPLQIELHKRIPVGAGLAGGSSNAAATLRGISELLGIGVAPPSGTLSEMALSLGADVPFCLTGGTALAEGVGEKLTPLPSHPPCYIVLACPEIHVSTADIFFLYDMVCAAGSAFDMHKQAMLQRETGYKSPPIDLTDIKKTAASFYNAFTPITGSLHPEIPALINECMNLGALGASMSGTGPAVFAYFDNEQHAQRACSQLKQTIKKVFLCKTQAAAQSAPPQRSEEA